MALLHRLAPAAGLLVRLRFLITVILPLVLIAAPGQQSMPKGNAVDEYIHDDGGIRQVYLNGVPHLNRQGQVQYTYNSDSVFPLIMYFPDLGDFGDSKRRFNPGPDHTRGALPQIKSAGFNTLWTSWWSPTEDELKYIRDVGLRIFPNLQAIVYESVNSGNWGRLTQEITRLKTEPTVLGYHLFDEDPTDPGPLGPPVQVDQAHWQGAYNIIKQADPQRVVFPNNISSDHACTYIPLGGTTMTYDFRGFSDLWMVDAYMIFNQTTNLDEIVDRHDWSIQSCSGLGGPAKPYIFLAQTYYDVNDGRARPGPALMRSYLYSAIVHGATGLAYFRFHTTWVSDGSAQGFEPWYVNRPNFGALSPEVSPELWAEVTKINKEIETNKQIFFSNTSPDEYHILLKRGQATAQHPINTLLKDGGNWSDRYLLAVNVDSEPIDTKFEFARQLYRVTSQFDSRDVPPSGSQFGEILEGYGVRLYKVEYAAAEGILPPQTAAPTVHIPPVFPWGPGVVKENGWSLRNSASAGAPDTTYTYGRSGDLPVAGDWNGDGIRTPGAVRNTEGSLTWYLAHKHASAGPNITVNYGRAGDIPVTGDWDGDSRDTIGVFRDGAWILTNDFGKTLFAAGFGQPGDLPVTGDWNGDGTDDIGVYRNGSWILTTDHGVTRFAAGFGQAGDMPVVGDWNGDGKSDIGVFRSGTWILTNDLGQSTFSFDYGDPTGIPIAGRWSNP